MTTKRKRIAVLMGGVSAEREISLASGAAVADALEARGHEVLRLDVGEDVDRQLRLARQQFTPDAAFIALHGTFGEDGCVQGMLECLGIPYTGSSVLSSALAMDKLKSKELFRLHNVPTPPYYVAKQSDLADLEDLHGSFGFPAIVKPRAEGSSIGISRAQNLAELAVGVRRALDLGHDALVERWVKGAEVQVGILGGRVLGAIEVEPKNRPFYDFVAKYTPGQTEYHLPPRLSPTRVRGVMNLAERAARALGVEGACRVDMIVTEGENEYVLEVNTLPGMTQTSLLPKIAAAAGYDFGALCEAIVDLAKLHVPRARPAAAYQAANDARPSAIPVAVPATRPLRVAARTR
ncbi:MAG: D-alanine--D-alanine ligase [Myxococcales bacterium]|nr:D-alanine--D-alanine ligase [Myxococcales bacterium]